jgi:hypothetical protein
VLKAGQDALASPDALARTGSIQKLSARMSGNACRPGERRSSSAGTSATS